MKSAYLSIYRGHERSIYRFLTTSRSDMTAKAEGIQIEHWVGFMNNMWKYLNDT